MAIVALVHTTDRSYRQAVQGLVGNRHGSLHGDFAIEGAIDFNHRGPSTQCLRHPTTARLRRVAEIGTHLCIPAFRPYTLLASRTRIDIVLTFRWLALLAEPASQHAIPQHRSSPSTGFQIGTQG